MRHAPLAVLGLSLALSLPTRGVQHPVLLDPIITSCLENGPLGPCASRVYYQASGIGWADVVPLSPPDPTLGTRLTAVGVHCDTGNPLTNTPFDGCHFSYEPSHTPMLVSSCHLRTTDSWEIAYLSSCTLFSRAWGPHSGASPGGECIMFVQRSPSPTLVSSIYGLVDAKTVANSGNRFCQKPLPPSAHCDITLPSTLDHGVLGTDSVSSITVTGDIDCGDKPVVTIVGGGRLTLADGVTTNLTTRFDPPNRISLTSDLRAVHGDTGSHSASLVVLVSPY